MKATNRYERIMKDLDALTTAVDVGAKVHTNLDAKVDAYRLKTILQRVRCQLRVEYFAIQDATGLTLP